MKKTVLILCLALAALFTAPLQAQTGSVTLNFTLGELQDATGNPLADGVLLQVLSLSSGSLFGGPTAESFLGENEILLWSGGFDSSTTGLPGAMLLSMTLAVQAGEGGPWPREFAPLLIRWFPTLSGSGAPNAPGSVAYGEYGAGVSGWLIPTAGGLGDPVFLTESLGGTDANALGIASQQIVAVPEPGAMALIGLAWLGGWAHCRRKRVCSQP